MYFLATHNATIGIIQGNALAQEASAVVVFVKDGRFGWIRASAGQGGYRVGTAGIIPTCAGTDGGSHGGYGVRGTTVVRGGFQVQAQAKAVYACAFGQNEDKKNELAHSASRSGTRCIWVQSKAAVTMMEVLEVPVAMYFDIRGMHMADAEGVAMARKPIGDLGQTFSPARASQPIIFLDEAMSNEPVCTILLSAPTHSNISMRRQASLLLCCLFVLDLAMAAPKVVLGDHTAAAALLFSNMRAPAALIGASTVPLGILSAPIVESTDNARAIRLKNANMLLAIVSLLNQVLAIVYSTVAVNKIAELTYEPTEGVAQFIEKYHELSWVGTNVHFLLGLMGFACLALAKPYHMYGKNVGDVAACWIGAAMIMCVSIVNRGISQGHGTMEDASLKFANNLGGLVVTYAKLLLQECMALNALPVLSIGLVLASVVPVTRAWKSTREVDKRD